MPIKYANTTIGFPQDSLWNYISDNLELTTRITTEMVDGCNTGLLTVCEKSMKTEPKFPGIRSILANHKKNAFTVAWDDRTATTIHLQEGDTWDDEKALAMCYVKKLMGNKGSFNYVFTQELPKKLKIIKTEKELEMEELHKQMDKLKNVVDSFTSACNAAAETTPDKIDPFQSKVNELLGDSKKTEKTEMFYSVYAYNTYTKRRELLDGANPMTLRDAKKRVNMIQTVSGYPHVSRVWEVNNELYIDYGSHVNYIVIPGLTSKEYLG